MPIWGEPYVILGCPMARLYSRFTCRLRSRLLAHQRLTNMQKPVIKPNFMLPLQAMWTFLFSMFFCILKEARPMFGSWPDADASPMYALNWLIGTVIVPSVAFTFAVVWLLNRRHKKKCLQEAKARQPNWDEFYPPRPRVRCRHCYCHLEEDSARR